MAATMDWILEIHHINVEAGDATAIVVRDTGNNIISKVLIDAGAEGRGYGRLKSYAKKYLTNKLVSRPTPEMPGETTVEPFDYIIASHYHNDHIDGFQFCDFPFKQYIDIGGYEVFKPINGRGSLKGKYFTRYRDYIDSYMKQGAIRTEIPFITADKEKNKPGALKIELGVGTGITLTCYCANGILANGTNVLDNQKKAKLRETDYDPNDLSLAFILEWGDFRYFTAGDLTGDTSFASYYNVEKPLVEYLTGTEGPLAGGKTITVLKVDHHGSEYSTYQNADDEENTFLKALKPEVVIVPCNTRKQVPSQKFLVAAKAYCESEKAPLLFVNQLFYPKQNSRYGALNSIKTDLSSNLEYDDTYNPPYISSLKTNAVIIRRTSIPVSDDEKMLDAKDNEKILLEGKNYEIIVNKGEVSLGEVQKAIRRISTYSIDRSIDPDSLWTSIEAGFGEQAKELAEWLELDGSYPEKPGAEFIKEYFPALEEAATADALKQEMKTLFDKGYTKRSFIGGGMFFAYQSNKLNLDERQTLYNLLLNNKYQQTLNKQWKSLWKQREAWNYGNSVDPYISGPPEEAITKGRSEDLPPAKRSKTTSSSDTEK